MSLKRLSPFLTLLVITVLLVMPLQNFSVSALTNEETEQIRKLEQQLNKAIQKKEWNFAATYSKKLAEIFDKRKQYKKAVKYYDLNAKYWAKDGHATWGIQNSIRADHLRTQVQLYVGQPAPKNTNLAKYEPAVGTYLGMYVAGKRSNDKVSAINKIYEKDHALYLTYAHWRRPYPETDSFFPLNYAKQVKAVGGALQVAWEPSYGLDDVKDDEYVRQFAKEAASTGVPIFLRFAGEMNGEWVPWYDKPKKYIKKFRLIHDIMEEEAPNVAMVWSPNFLPRHNTEPFYPGDEYVDWVGFSLYTIPYSHGKEVPGGNPIDYLRPLYNKYSHKPIMISEGAVSFYSYEIRKDFTDWAVGQLGNMYGYLPRIFPMVKSITYFNLDKKTMDYDNKNNNYDLGDRPEMDNRYNKMITNGQFLSKVNTGSRSKNNLIYKPISQLKNLKGQHNVFAYVKLPLGKHPTTVRLYNGDRLLDEANQLPWDMKVDFSNLNRGDRLKIVALDEEGKVLATQTYNVE